jgi:hypothetical protein
MAFLFSCFPGFLLDLCRCFLEEAQKENFHTTSTFFLDGGIYEKQYNQKRS